MFAFYKALRPSYKIAEFWLSAPGLAWGLFSYKQTLSYKRIGQLIALIVLAESALLYKTKIYGFFSAQRLLHDTEAESELFMPHNKEAESEEVLLTQLLKAVAYGMESQESNVAMAPEDTAGLFKHDLYAKDLLIQSPARLLKRGDVTDWAGRDFKNITAFEYALWAQDFKMIEMMLKCIPDTEEGDAMWEALFEQAKQVKAPVYAGGGLTYTHTYDRPNLDASGIPDGTTTRVTEQHTENYFDLAPLCNVYQNYGDIGKFITYKQLDNYLVKLIGTLQRLLPVHILQRYFDPNTPFSPIPQFDKCKFTRSTTFSNESFGILYCASHPSSLFVSSLSIDFALSRRTEGYLRAIKMKIGSGRYSRELEAIRQLKEVSTSEIEKMIGQLSQPRHTAESRPIVNTP